MKRAGRVERMLIGVFLVLLAAQAILVAVWLWSVL